MITNKVVEEAKRMYKGNDYLITALSKFGYWVAQIALSTSIACQTWTHARFPARRALQAYSAKGVTGSKRKGCYRLTVRRELQVQRAKGVTGPKREGCSLRNQ